MGTNGLFDSDRRKALHAEITKARRRATWVFRNDARSLGDVIRELGGVARNARNLPEEKLHQVEADLAGLRARHGLDVSPSTSNPGTPDGGES